MTDSEQSGPKFRSLKVERRRAAREILAAQPPNVIPVVVNLDEAGPSPLGDHHRLVAAARAKVDEEVAAERAEVGPLPDVIDAEVVEPLGREAAESLDRRIRQTVGFIHDGVEKLLGLVEEAKAGQIHVALGYASWGAYLADVGTVPVKLARANRALVANKLSDEGVSQRIIASLLNVSVGTVNHDLASGVQNRTPGGDTAATEVTTGSQDGKRYPKRKAAKQSGELSSRPAKDAPEQQHARVDEDARPHAVPRCPDCGGPMGLTQFGEPVARACKPCARARNDVDVLAEFDGPTGRPSESTPPATEVAKEPPPDWQPGLDGGMYPPAKTNRKTPKPSNEFVAAVGLVVTKMEQGMLGLQNKVQQEEMAANREEVIHAYRDAVAWVVDTGRVLLTQYLSDTKTTA
jgi:hypothetical protein